MPKTKAKSPHVTIKIPIELIREMDVLVGQHGYKSRAEVAKDGVRKLLDFYGITRALPRFEKVNSDEQGAKVFDRQIGEVVQVYIRPEGIHCFYHKTDNCEHIEYILSLKDIQEIVKQRKREGWKLP
jgi:Arc/MetJ-type ribon-helix-helix transcriptional regulator